MLTAAILAAGVQDVCAQHAKRIVSVNLCADQLLLALADPQQIVSLGPFARDKSQSFLSEEAQKYPATRGSAEEMTGLKADLVLLGSFDSRYARAVLERQSIAFMLLEPWRDIAQGLQQIRDVASRIGQTDRAEALIASIRKSLEKLEAQATHRSAPVSALVLQKRGYAMHSGVVADLARIAGLANAAVSLGLNDSRLIAMERIVAHPPDYLIVSQDFLQPADQGEAVLAHPVLTRLFPPDKRLTIAGQLSTCAGPSTPALIETFSMEIAQKVQ